MMGTAQRQKSAPARLCALGTRKKSGGHFPQVESLLDEALIALPIWRVTSTLLGRQTAASVFPAHSGLPANQIGWPERIRVSLLGQLEMLLFWKSQMKVLDESLLGGMEPRLVGMIPEILLLLSRRNDKLPKLPNSAGTEPESSLSERSMAVICGGNPEIEPFSLLKLRSITPSSVDWLMSGTSPTRLQFRRLSLSSEGILPYSAGMVAPASKWLLSS
ncbi:hypothetical protein Mapa_009288 [Marchantia paleacea]|nr:hypothetical protein Mapa_009288 [Marchantia paleacea]